MEKKLTIVALAILAFALAPRLDAGTEIVRDYSGGAPLSDYTPPTPPPVCYARPPVRIVVYPAVRYYAPPVRVIAYQRVYGRPVRCIPDWR
jgi:hypothetical protein